MAIEDKNNAESNLKNFSVESDGSVTAEGVFADESGSFEFRVENRMVKVKDKNGVFAPISNRDDKLRKIINLLVDNNPEYTFEYIKSTIYAKRHEDRRNPQTDEEVEELIRRVFSSTREQISDEPLVADAEELPDDEWEAFGRQLGEKAEDFVKKHKLGEEVAKLLDDGKSEEEIKKHIMMKLNFRNLPKDIIAEDITAEAISQGTALYRQVENGADDVAAGLKEEANAKSWGEVMGGVRKSLRGGLKIADTARKIYFPKEAQEEPESKEAHNWSWAEIVPFILKQKLVERVATLIDENASEEEIEAQKEKAKKQIETYLFRFNMTEDTREKIATHVITMYEKQIKEGIGRLGKAKVLGKKVLDKAKDINISGPVKTATEWTGKQAKRGFELTKDAVKWTGKQLKGARDSIKEIKIPEWAKKTAIGLGIGAPLILGGLGAYGTVRLVGGTWNLVKSEASAIKKTGLPVVKDLAKTVAWHPIRGAGRVVATPVSRMVQGFKAGLNYPAKPNKSEGKGFFGKSWAGMKNLTKGAWYRTKQLGSIPAGLVMGGLGAVEGVADVALKDVIGLNKGSAEMIGDAWKYGKSLGPNGKKAEIGKYALEAGLAGTVWDTLKFGKGMVWDGPKDWWVGPQELDAEGKPVEAKVGEDGKPAEKTPGIFGKVMNIFSGKKEIGDVVRIKEVWDDINKEGKPWTAEGLGKITDAVVNYLNLEEKYGAIFAATGFAVKTLAGKFLPKSFEKMDIKFEEFGKTIKGLKKEKVDGFVEGIDADALKEYFKILTNGKLLDRAMKNDSAKTLIKAKLKSLIGDEEFFDGESLKASLEVLKNKIGGAKNADKKDAVASLLDSVKDNLTDEKLAELFFDEKVAKTKIDYDNFGDNVYELIADKNVGREGVLRAFSDKTFEHTFDDILQPTTLADALLSENGKKGIRELLKVLFDLQDTTKLDPAKLKSQGERLMEKFGDKTTLNDAELEKKYGVIEKLIAKVVTNLTPHVAEIYAEELEFTWANFANEMDGLNRINREFYMRGVKSHPNKFRRSFGAIMKEENLQRLLTLGEDDRKTAQQSVRYLMGVPVGSVQLSELVETIDEYLKKIGEPTEYTTDLQEACTLFRKNLTDIKECLSTGDNLKNLFGNVLIQPMGIKYDSFGSTLRTLPREKHLSFLAGYNDGDFYERFNILMESDIPAAKREEAKIRLFELLGINDKNTQLTSSLVKRIIESMLSKFGNPTEIGSYEARANHLQLSTALNAIKSNMTEKRIESIYAKSAA